MRFTVEITAESARAYESDITSAFTRLMDSGPMAAIRQRLRRALLVFAHVVAWMGLVISVIGAIWPNEGASSAKMIGYAAFFAGVVAIVRRGETGLLLRAIFVARAGLARYRARKMCSFLAAQAPISIEYVLNGSRLEVTAPKLAIAKPIELGRLRAVGGGERVLCVKTSAMRARVVYVPEPEQRAAVIAAMPPGVRPVS